MPSNEDVKQKTAENPPDADLRIEGAVKLEAADTQPADLTLRAYVFDQGGRVLGEANLDAKGTFSVPVKLAAPDNVELVIGPDDDPATVRRSSAHSQHISANEWVREGKAFRVRPQIFLPRDLWWSWRPRRICVSGHVRKVHTTAGQTEICPVPFVKVEIFDVDREACWDPYLTLAKDLFLDRPVIRIPDLIKERTSIPFPIPGPGPVERAGIRPGEEVALNPQPLPPRESKAFAEIAGSATLSDSAGARAKPAQQLTATSSLASKLEDLTLTSIVAPWVIRPRCFYSKKRVCRTTTDCNGFFRCCFNWPVFHFRQGRLRFDPRPDIIIRVTQVIDGVETVIYMDPYSSTRWNVTNAHIDLYLDNEDVHCGSGDCHGSQPGSPVFFTRIGDDEVYQINQANGLYEVAPYTNVAYGGSLLVYAQFGDDLTDGSPARYYRLSYARQGTSDFTPITTPLSDTRVNKLSFFSESHTLGPQVVNGVPALFEVRNFAGYYWYNPDWIGTWYSWLAEADANTYILRLEVFDQNGVLLTSASVDYRDGTVTPPTTLPPMTQPPRTSVPPAVRVDRCDLVITLDNKPPVVDLQIPAVLNDCGVIPFASVPPLDFNAHVFQENGRLNSWALTYTHGVLPAVHSLPGGGGSSTSGAPATINQTVSGSPLLVGLTTTCAFALKLSATAHIRDGRNFIYYVEQIKAIAIEKCVCPPEVVPG
ncbi:MAG TPA: hypothetical protein VGV87_17220 [Blastocatellia bacterium]|nr:hypothetical protein [Blastocatellia bacterium]